MLEIRRKHVMSLPDKVHELANAFHKAGHQLYVVGGAVRDSIMGIEPKDFDLATDADPRRVAEIVVSLTGAQADEVGAAFGVVLARMYTNEFEIATFREDITAGRHPQVRFATIKEDVRRRDLTMNALFYNINLQEVVDLVGGLHDIENCIIRTVGRPQDRFAEDRLRILRAIRFASRYNFVISEETSRALCEDNSLNGISFERIRDEFVKSVNTSKDIEVFLGLMDRFNMWEQVFPNLHVDTSMVDPLYADNLPVLLAMLLGKNVESVVHRKLLALRYTDVEAKQVLFLMNFRKFKKDDAYRTRRLFLQNKLERHQLFEYASKYGPDARLVSAFAAYLSAEPIKGDNLLAQGFSGSALGKEMERRELELFDELLGAL